MTDRSATIAPTPMAMQTKKNTSRFQADRVSRSAVMQDEPHQTPTRSATLPSRRYTRASAIAAIS